jgi:predicted DNA-binding antitoxin AbrB/MazE fold protein
LGHNLGKANINNYMPKPQTIEAIYENGVFRPLKVLDGLAENSQVKITIESDLTQPHPLLQFAGILSDEEASELQNTIANEFGKIDPNVW